MPPLPGLVGGSGTTSSEVLDCEETINFIVEKGAASASSGGALLSTPGFTLFTTATQVGSRGAIFLPDIPTLLFAVGSRLFEIDSVGTVTDRGSIGVDSTPVLMVYNQQNGQVGIVASGNVYCYTVATHTLSAALLSGGYTHIAFAQGQGFAFNYTTGLTVLSDLNDLATWNVGIFFQRGVFYDPPMAMFSDENNLVWTLGTETFEVRFNSGTGTQPWTPLTGLVGPWGTPSKWGFGLSPVGNFWITSNKAGVGRFVVSRGGVPTPVGTYAIDSQLDAVAAAVGVDDAEVMLYDQGGHVTANLALAKGVVANPTKPGTYTYDISGETWTKRGKWNRTLGRWELWAPRVHVLAYGKHMVGDRTTGKIWILDPLVATDVDGLGVRRLRRTPHLISEHRRIPIRRVELLMDVGLAGQGVDPVMMFRTSTDGGRTWGDERTSGIGTVGDYRKSVYWSQVSAAGDVVLEFSCSEPVPYSIVDGWVNNSEFALPTSGAGARR